MAGILTSLQNTVIAGIVLAALLLALVPRHRWRAGLRVLHVLFRWLHVLSGVMWIGILWYFNFVQIPNMGNIPDDQKPAISKVIAPAALWWFRWGAMATLATGLILAHMNGYLVDAIHAWRFRRGEAYDDRYRYVAWSNYVLQRLVHYLAKSENSSRHRRCGSGR